MKLYSAAQMRDADALAAASGVPTALLMDAAGRGVAHALLAAYPAVSRVLVLCGVGHNGGDGYVAATELLARGVSVSVYELEGAGNRAGDAADARARYLAAGGTPQLLTEAALTELRELARAPSGGERPTVFLDALFGTGLSRPLEGTPAAAVTLLAEASQPVVAVDVPSGLNADLAEATGPHGVADLTVELAGRKPAGLFYPNRYAYGRRVLLDIGVPPAVLASTSDTEFLSAQGLAPHLPALAPDAHKYSAGTVAVVAGSPAYLGAAELACRAAWRGGAGLVTLVAQERLAGAWPETIFVRHAPAEWPPAQLEARRAGALVIGPGLDERSVTALPAMLAWAPGPVVLDAAALDPAQLNAAADRLRRTPAVLTPHSGEAARLLAGNGNPGDAALVKRDPLGAARQLAERYGAVVVLKGPATVVADPHGHLAVSDRGTPALATGGTGDVLAGLIGALLARAGGADAPFERACLGVWLHGVAGEAAALQVGESLLASDVVAHLPHAFRQLADRDA